MKAVITIIILALIAWTVYAWVGKDKVVAPLNTNAQDETLSNTTSPTATSTQTVKEFTVEGKNFSFTPATITVDKGDLVRIIFKNQGGNHNWVIDEFNAHTSVIGSGESETIEFVADKTGSFEYYCAVGTHRQMGMRGTLVVR